METGDQARTGVARATCICRGCTRAMRLAERAALGRCTRTVLKVGSREVVIADAMITGCAESFSGERV